MNISEDQKRWLVIGIAFNKLVSQIRPFVEQSLQAEYQRLRSTNNIHVQTPPGILKNHPKHLKYENINSNINHKLSSGKFDFSKFDYKVTSHVDFAKLYVQPFMAKFSAFDGKCDGSAVLLLLGEVPVFSPALQSSAKTVREHVRNEWAHCNFTDWDAVKFQSCFREMQQLVQSVGLPAADESKILSELNDWETKGTTFCGNSPVDPSLLSLVQNEVSQLSSNLENFVCQYKEQNDLFESQFLEVKQSLYQKVERIDDELQTLKQQVADLSCSSVKSKESKKLPIFFGALDRNEYFTGRKNELENLQKDFNTTVTPDTHGVTRRKETVHGICGLGGCGKSSLAFEYAWRNMERYPGGVFVVNGESDDLMRASFQRIHGAFVHNTQSNQHQGETKQFDQLLNETLSWLGNLKDKWLLLVDNMDQQELSSCARTMFLGQWKSNTSVDILVTSRKNTQALCEDLDLSSEKCFELDPFAVDESVEFLKKRTGLTFSCEDQDQGERELAQELGGLPLALEQAAAYIKALKCPIQLYLKQYRSQKSSFLNTKRAKPRSEIYNEARLTVQTTWLLNFSYIENDEKDQGLGKAAAFFMTIAAYLSPDEIPIEILNVGAPEIENEDLKKRLEMHLVKDQIVELLLRFSLFKRKSDDALSMHRLVQETLKERCDSGSATDEVLSSAIRMMHQSFFNCVCGTEYLHEMWDRCAFLTQKKPSDKKTQLENLKREFKEVTFESTRWTKLSVNAFHLLINLSKSSFLKPYLFREESARLFGEAAAYCCLLGMENQGYSLQQFVLEIISAIKEPIRYYKDDDLLKLTRILRPITDSVLLSFAKSVGVGEKVSEETGVMVDTNQTDDKFLEAIKPLETAARDAFSRRDFQTSADLYTVIVKRFNFEANSGIITLEAPRLVPLGDIFCRRDIAHVQMGNFETAVDDFNACTCVDIQCYRGYFWKAYALCKLVERGRIEFTSRAQAAAALLHYKFLDSKTNDIHKLQKRFPELLERIDYKFVSQVSELKELERLSEVRSDLLNCSLTIILAEGSYDLKKLTLLGGRYYFVCLPGCSASLNCIKGICLSQGAFLFENIQFNYCNEFRSVSGCAALQEMSPVMTSENGVKEVFVAGNLDTLTFERTDQAKTEAAGGTEQELCALIQADDVHSLVVNHCNIDGSACHGISVTLSNSSLKQRTVSVKSSAILLCEGAGLQLQGDANIDIHGNLLEGNLYGIFIDSTSRFDIENNVIRGNIHSGVVAKSVSRGRLLGNLLFSNGRHGILLSKTNAVIEKNQILNNQGWGIVCSSESNLDCKENLLVGNVCGGLRIIFNGKGNVLVQGCEFRENSGPAVLPTAANELCRVELEWKQLFASPPDHAKRLGLYLFYFLECIVPNWESIREFKSPMLLDNRVSDVSDMPFHIESHSCCTCLQDLQLGSDLIECPNCRVARYCSQQCSEAAKAVHYTGCKAILEANKECLDYNTRKVSDAQSSVQEGDRNSEGTSLCVIASITPVPPPGDMKVDLTLYYRACLLTCPQRNLYTVVNSSLLHHFVLIHGRHLPDHMMGIKAACILANFDSESKMITVYKHRIFPLEKVPDALKWVEKTLHVFEQRVVGGDAPRNDALRPWKRTSRKRKQRVR